MRLRRAKNVAARLERFRNHLLLEAMPLDFHAIFGNTHPVYAEFGMGKGDFLLEMARRHPEINFLGVERVDSIILKAMEKVTEESNVRFLRANVEDLEEVIPPDSIHALYLNFSDPWPKKKNRKRRLTHREYLEKYDEWLLPGALIQLKTDSASLFAFTIEEVSQTGHVLEDVTLDISSSAAYRDNVQTEYEAKFSSEGHPIYALRFRSRKGRP